jgi:putative phosphonoacetaldehyde dehydrogenase
MKALAEARSTVRHEPMRIAGRLVDSSRSIEVLDPYTGGVVGTVPMATVGQVREAFATAAIYQTKLTRYERQNILFRTAEILKVRKEEISNLITAEGGICKKDSLYEVGRACDVFTLAGQTCILDDGQIFSCNISPHGEQRKIYTLREPLQGVISAITPFNHPLNQVAHKVAPSIATNNRMVVKPSEKTPLTAVALADILYEAGLPPAMFSVVTGDPVEIGDEMVTNEHAELITFTGEARIGKSIASKVGYRRMVLELGGNDPLIVMEDADLDKAAELAVAGSYKNSGQRCTAVKRILVIEGVADRFAELVVEKTRRLVCGDPKDPKTDIGAVITEQAACLFEARVKDAIAKGAKLLWGNERRGALYSPTVVDYVPYDCELVREETFGPVAPIIRCEDMDDVIRVSNSTVYGLSSGLCTNRLDYITRLIKALRVGTINVWEVPGYRTEMSPFGGIKDSGLGYKEGVIEAMKSFTNIKAYSLPWL